MTESYLQGLAAQIPGLSLSDWSSARNETSFNDEITTDAQTANQNGFTGTPSFLISKTGGTPKDLKYASLTDPSSFEDAISKQLKG